VVVVVRTFKFSHNWNNKLDCPWFTTIRLWPHKGPCCIRRPDGTLFDAVVVAVEERRISTLTAFETLLDAGLHPNQFFALMKKFYCRKEEWNDRETKVYIHLITDFRWRLKFNNLTLLGISFSCLYSPNTLLFFRL